jgi:hypothetical protein
VSNANVGKRAPLNFAGSSSRRIMAAIRAGSVSK